MVLRKGFIGRLVFFIAIVGFDMRCNLSVYYRYFLAQLTMSARAFPITLCSSSVRLLDYSLKPISSYSFGRIASKFNTGIKHDITHLACAFFDHRTIFEFLVFFEIFK